MALTRLRMDELVNAWIGDRDTPFQLGLLAVFEVGPFLLPCGSLDTGLVVRELSVRALGVPELRRRVRWTGPGEGAPVWVDVADDVVRGRVGAIRVAPDTPLPTWAANRTILPLGRDQPLWRAEVVDGLPDGRFAILVVVHHVLADGMAGMRLLTVMLEAEPDVVRDEPPVRTPASPPTRRDLLRDRMPSWRTLAQGGRRGGALGWPCRRPARSRSGPRQALAEYREAMSAFSTPRPRTSLPRTVGPTRLMAVASADLDALSRRGHRLGATVNDQLLAAVTHGLRDMLTARSECRPGLFVRTILPVAGASAGQAASMMVVDLPVGEPDPARRLASIVEQTSTRKARLRATGGSGPHLFAVPIPVARILIPWARRRGSRMIDLSVTNVPGPAAPLWFAGAKMIEALPIAPLVPVVGLTVAALSYNGRLVVTVNADGAVHDLHVLGGGIARALTEPAP